MGSGLKVSIKNPFGSFKLKGSPGAVSNMADKLQDSIPKPNIEASMPGLSDNSLPRDVRTQREKSAVPFKFRYRGSGEQ